ncbi:DNA cytosine methyltransferase [Cloacibacillus porcorum]|uniref:DNA cytosine methyltransferase n=1 Tax=Cloacibacillus porcorum TaxID=1197717 RepID=UPI002671BFD1|nr:DNA cytosine methyltransferase [Cloacibacillus porcorum]
MGLIIDLFAGGGGTSLGIERALGRSPDIAVNHDPEAVAMHKANHPHTKHYCENVAFIAQYHGEQSGREMRGQALDGPLMVVDANPRYAICAAHLAKHYGGVVGQAVESPVGTTTAADHHSLVACTLMRQFGTSTGAPVDRPVGTVMPEGRGKTGLVAAFLAKYYGAEREGIPLNGPLHTICGKDKFAVVTVSIGGEEYAVYDIGMRMLQPRELFRAQGFGDDYIIDLVYEGKYLSKSAQVRMVGNSVCPPIAEAIVKANCAFMQEEREVA